MYYSTNSEERKYIVFVIAILSVGVIYLLNQILDLYQYFIPFELQPPSVATIFGLFYVAFDKYIWKLSLIKKLSIVKVPDLNGDWIVTFKSSYHENDIETKANAEIRQTWTKISIKMETDSSYSYSNSASILLDTVEGDTINYTYLNKPYADASDSMNIHEGTVKLRIRNNLLDGDYYSGKYRGNYGSISFEPVK